MLKLTPRARGDRFQIKETGLRFEPNAGAIHENIIAQRAAKAGSVITHDSSMAQMDGRKQIGGCRR
jgi:hypothetical protein